MDAGKIIKNSNDLIISYVDLVAGVLAITLEREARKILGELPIINVNDIDILVSESSGYYVYSVSGDFGTRINNPEVRILLTEELDGLLPWSSDLLNQTVFNNYTTLRLLEIGRKYREGADVQ